MSYAMKDIDHKLHWIQSLRGIAALLVVLTHARYFLYGTSLWPKANSLLMGGGMGVDLFFVISGFIMCHTNTRSDGSWAYTLKFLIKRIARIWPVYAIATVFFVVVGYHGLNYFHDSANRMTFLKSMFFLPADPSKPLYFGLSLPLGWTLNFEIYFYLVFAACLFFNRFKYWALTAWMSLTVLILPTLSRGFTLDVLANPGFSGSYWNIAMNPIVLEFLAGIFICLLYFNPAVKIKQKWLAHLLATASVLFAIYSIYVVPNGFHGPAHWGFSIMIMVLVLAITSKTIRFVPPAAFVWLGEISFSLYITHTTSQSILSQSLNHFKLEPMIHTWFFVIISTIFALAIATISYFLLERGVSEYVRNHLLRLVPRKTSTT
jgi:exopolysaccharide production protein ExoZ